MSSQHAMLIMSIWGLLAARLTYSFIGAAAPELMFSPLYIVLASLTMVPVGAWFGALVYSLWPTEARFAAFRATPDTLLRVAVLTLPLFYLLWPIIKYWDVTTCFSFLLLTISPCFTRLLLRWYGAITHPKGPDLTAGRVRSVSRRH